MASILPELEEPWDRLYALTLFLEEKCGPPDHTSSAMTRIITLEEDIREVMFKSGDYPVLLTEPPYLLTHFDPEVLLLL